MMNDNIAVERLMPTGQRSIHDTWNVHWFSLIGLRQSRKPADEMLFRTTPPPLDKKSFKTPAQCVTPQNEIGRLSSYFCPTRDFTTKHYQREALSPAIVWVCTRETTLNCPCRLWPRNKRSFQSESSLGNIFGWQCLIRRWPWCI